MGEQTKPMTLTVKIDPELSSQFKKIASENNRTQSILIRDWIMAYVKKNGQGDLFK